MCWCASKPTLSAWSVSSCPLNLSIRIQEDCKWSEPICGQDTLECVGLLEEQHTYCNEKASQKYWTRKSPDSQNIFLSSSSLDTLIKNWWLFHDGFCTKQQHFTLSSVLAHRFFTTLKSHEAVRTSHWRTMALLAMPFSKIVHMHANHLATKPFLFKLEIRLCAWRREESWHPLLTQCLKRAWSTIFQPMLPVVVYFMWQQFH